MSRTTARLDKPPDTFESLNARHPLRPIQDQPDRENAREVADALAVLRKRNKDQKTTSKRSRR